MLLFFTLALALGMCVAFFMCYHQMDRVKILIGKLRTARQRAAALEKENAQLRAERAQLRSACAEWNADYRTLESRFLNLQMQAEKAGLIRPRGDCRVVFSERAMRHSKRTTQQEIILLRRVRRA